MIILATSNENKVKEYKEIYPHFDYITKQINQKITENGYTFLENAYIKAKAYFDEFKAPVLADDSGLEIESLNNFPGIFSSRFAFPIKDYKIKNQLILDMMKDSNNRRARFVCCICFIDLDGNKYLAEGIVNGTIAKSISGDNGFGYDAIFIPDGFDKTFASMDNETKNKLSHRYVAFNKLLEKLPKRIMRREYHD